MVLKLYECDMWGMKTLSRKATRSKLFWIPSEKRSTLKENNLLPSGANSFLSEQTPFQKGTGMQKKIK